jgi:hypothetical protein
MTTARVSINPPGAIPRRQPSNLKSDAVYCAAATRFVADAAGEQINRVDVFKPAVN